MSAGPGVRPRLAPRPAPGWLLGVLLLGILGMHGLSSHGVGGSGHAAHGAVPVAAMTYLAAGGEHSGHTAQAGHTAHAGHAAMATTSATSSAAVVPAASPSEPDGAPTGAVELCVAVLAGFVLLLLARRAAGRGRRLPRLLRVAMLRFPGRVPDPPSLETLSLLRC